MSNKTIYHPPLPTSYDISSITRRGHLVMRPVRLCTPWREFVVGGEYVVVKHARSGVASGLYVPDELSTGSITLMLRPDESC